MIAHVHAYVPYWALYRIVLIKMAHPVCAPRPMTFFGTPCMVHPPARQHIIDLKVLNTSIASADNVSRHYMNLS